MAGLPHYKNNYASLQKCISNGAFCPSCGETFLSLGHGWFGLYNDKADCYCGWSGNMKDLISTVFPEYPPVSDLRKNKDRTFKEEHLISLSSNILSTINYHMYWERENDKSEHEKYNLNEIIKEVIDRELKEYDPVSFLKIFNKCLYRSYRDGYHETYTEINDIPPKEIVDVCYEFLKTPTFIKQIFKDDKC